MNEHALGTGAPRGVSYLKSYIIMCGIITKQLKLFDITLVFEKSTKDDNFVITY